MSYTDTDINILADLIRTNGLSLAEVIDWAYSQYAEESIEPWIEKLSLANDKKEALEILQNNFNITEELGQEILAGKVAFEYFQKKTDLHETLSRLLFDIFSGSELNEEKTDLYMAEDFFRWHHQAESEALKVAKPVLEKYAARYKEARERFNTQQAR